MPDPIDVLDEQMMERALELAERGAGWASPNPMVGALVCQGERIIAEGWHERSGADHAERVALDSAGGEARGGTLYVTLEPCAHHGKTPPCVDRVLESGVQRVVVAMRDPNPLVNGRSIQRLQQEGVEVKVGVLEKRARFLNRMFLSNILRGRPWVTLKYAMTLDGRIATRSGDSKWISGEESRRLVHELRRRHRAVLVGYRTAVMDDPLLTCRVAADPPPRQPLRVIWGGDKPLSADTCIAQTAGEIPALHILHEGKSALDKESTVEMVQPGDNSVKGVLQELRQREIDGVLVEGGAHVLTRFFEAETVDEVYVFIAPKIVNDREALSPFVGDTPHPRLSDALEIPWTEVSRCGADVLVHGILTEL